VPSARSGTAVQEVLYLEIGEVVLGGSEDRAVETVYIVEPSAEPWDRIEV
tara:strand:+ start:6984 stop:7133 length:150 start_codon:yes stop_codon:yes gene_type:complete